MRDKKIFWEFFNKKMETFSQPSIKLELKHSGKKVY